MPIYKALVLSDDGGGGTPVEVSTSPPTGDGGGGGASHLAYFIYCLDNDAPISILIMLVFILC